MARSPRLSRFLTYVVERRLAGSGDALKEYAIGVDVFDRGPDFDPQVDTIVRVQARRLRARLEEYYSGAGQSDQVRIDLPKGGYVPEFRFVAPGNGRSPRVVRGASRLPSPRTSLIGRERELEELRRLLLGDDVRLVTLTGPGGSGKTRLAIASARESAGAFLGGVLFAPLANAAGPEAARTAIAKAAGLRRTAGRTLRDALLWHLGSEIRQPTLLVVDNLEQIPGVEGVISEVLDGSPLITVLATSRSPLRLYGEHEFAVPTLDTPEHSEAVSAEGLAKLPAVRLLVERAQAANRAFELTDDNAACIAQICQRLDGIPLAIELAAARLRTLTPGQLLVKLADPLPVLTSGPVDVPPRQRTLRATMDWSWSLLSEAEQRLFRRLAVCGAGCTYESAEAVADAAQDLGLGMAEGLDSLVEKSLLTVGEPIGEESFFTMLQTVREYGLEKLEASGEADTVRRALAAYCVVLAEEGWARNGQVGYTAWMVRCEAEYANISASLHWLLEQGKTAWATRICVALFPFWEYHEMLAEGTQQLDRLLRCADMAARDRAMAASCSAALVCLQSGLEAGVTAHELAMKLARELGDPELIAREANAVGGAYSRMGNFRLARTYYLEALTAVRDAGSTAKEAMLLSNLAEVASWEGQHAEADGLLKTAFEMTCREGLRGELAWLMHRMGDVARRRRVGHAAKQRYEEALKLFRALQDDWGVSRSLQELASMACEDGEFSAAKAMFGEALELLQGMSRKRGVGVLLDGLAVAQARLGRKDCALVLAGAASGLRESLGVEERPWSREDLARREQLLERVGVAQSSLETEPEWLRGRAMTAKEAVEFASTLRWSEVRRS